ncbi:galectin-3-binding protein [Echinops telfairi]|uniref:Galectin-3-binding protein n=1 Tax=Echinops telfairi TaxID=9371 RepID=A0AC55DV89_ECHTE|nr:galectin-3-binding protein [Echinops telfairi]
MVLRQLLWAWLLLSGTHGLDNGDMRLVGGSSSSEGRVEIFYRGQWGTVCDHRWDLIDASVVCRALGFRNATQALGKATFGSGWGPIMLDEVECTGTESSLAHCRSLGWLRTDCSHKEDAGVVCTNETGADSAIHTLDLSRELSEALGGVFDSQQGCDLFISVQASGAEALSLCAHTLILSSNPEAQTLLKDPSSSIIIEVDTECLPVVSDFVRYLYSRQLAVAPSSVKCFHQLASSYGAERLQDYCSRLFAILLPQDPTFQTALDLHTYALATRDTLLEGLCAQFLAWNFEALSQVAAWPHVPAALLRTLLSRSELAVSSELALLKAVDAWARKSLAPPAVVTSLLEEVRFPMILPADLFELQYNVSLLHGHEALLQSKMRQALEFHTVPPQLLGRYWGLNLTQDAYQPRLYTGSTWSTSISASPRGSFREDSGYYKRTYYQSYTPQPYGYQSYPYRSFRTPQHPSFLFQSTSLSWTLYHLPNMQSCWNYGFSCTSDELPALGLTRSSYPDAAIGFENKALMLCQGGFVVHVADFSGKMAPIPSALSGGNGSANASLFPCPSGTFSSFQVVIRPFYLTNSSLDF